MEESIVTKITTRILVGILILFMSSTLLRLGVDRILVKRLDMDNGFTRLLQYDIQFGRSNTDDVLDGINRVEINWAQLYPFEKTAESMEENTPKKTLLKSSWEKFNDRTSELKKRITELKTKLEQYPNEGLLFHDQWVLYANTYEKTINWEINPVNGYNGILTMEDGYLATSTPYTSTKPIFAKLKPFLTFLAEQEIPFLYIQAPGKICTQDTKVDSVVDFSNQKMDEFLTILEKANVNTLDLHAALHEAGLDHHMQFYKTDHHWKAETGLWATGVITEILNQKMNFSIDTFLYQKENYNYTVYKDWFLGSQGKKVTLARSDPEDISLICPKFETRLTLEIPSLSVDKTGDFDILYQYSYITEKDLYNKNPYAAYFYSIRALRKVTNHLAQNDKRILVIGDSFSNSMNPFLSLGVKHLETLDARLFTGSIKSYIKQNSFDAIILMYNPSMLFANEGFEFN